MKVRGSCLVEIIYFYISKFHETPFCLEKRLKTWDENVSLKRRKDLFPSLHILVFKRFENVILTLYLASDFHERNFVSWVQTSLQGCSQTFMKNTRDKCRLRQCRGISNIAYVIQLFHYSFVLLCRVKTIYQSFKYKQ